MSKTTAPLLSFDARGAVAKTVVYSSWKGRSYARRHVIPSNPQSTEQTKTRSVFSTLQAIHKLMPALASAPWDAYAKGQVMTARNAFSKFNIGNLRGETDLDMLTFSPGAYGGAPPVSATPTPGSGTLSIAVTAPSVLPSGWTVYSAVAVIIKDGDPQTMTDYNTFAVEDTTSAYVCAFSGLAAGVYQYRVFLKWTRPDGVVAYSPDIGGQSTVT